MHILNAPTRLMKQLGYAKGYEYDHNAPDAFSGQNYFPDGMAREAFYEPAERGFEREIGKRLDFLIQELLREANTLGSKSSSIEMTGISVDMKVAIEQLREQVQNVE